MFSDKDIYIVYSKENFEIFIEQLSEKYGVESESIRKNDIVFNDTFDWRLFSINKFLISTGKGIFFGNSTKENHFIRTKKKIQFAKDLPDSQIRDDLQKITGIRRLCRNYKFQEKKTTFKVLNTDGKIVCRFSLFEYLRKEKEDKQLKVISLKIDALRGYRRQANEINAIAGQFLNPSGNKTQMELILELTGEKPGGYSSKASYKLDSEMPSWLAVKTIYAELYSIMIQNEYGVKKNLDDEFLHDFRVAVRRTRSALSQLTKILPKDRARYFRQVFKFLQNSTNAARDFDVDIENKEAYKKLLPESLHAGVDSLTKYLKKERNKVQQQLIQLLNSEKYLKIKNEWSLFIANLDETIPDSGETFTPVSELASKNILSLLKKTISAGDRITDLSPDDEFHEFRIRLKQLRYLLEFFASIFVHKQMEFILKQLKIMQDNLGEFNDICIQQLKLSNYLTGLKLKPAQEKLILPTIGGLIAVKEQRKQQIKKEFFILYSEFSRKKNLRKFFEVFEGK